MNIPSFNYILLCTFVSLLSFSCKESTDAPPAEAGHEDTNEVHLTPAQVKTAALEFGTIEERQISGTIKVNGKLDVPPQQLVSISAPLGGFLKSTSLLQGSKVKKGQAIAVIENLDFIQIQQDYLEAKSHFEFAKADYERQQSLARENVNSEKTLQQAKANFSGWQAKYLSLREKLRVLKIDLASIEGGRVQSSITLHSPINGYVTDVNVNIGKFVSPTDILFEIVDTEHLHAELIIFEKDVPKLRLGQKVRFTLANETEERLATVYLIGREISEDRTVQIHCHIDKEDTELLPGMYLNALVETGGLRVPALPDEAIIDYQGQKFIFIVANDVGKKADADAGAEGKIFEMRPISTGPSELGYTEVNAEDANEIKSSSVVIKNGYALLSKMKNSEDEGGHAH